MISLKWTKTELLQAVNNTIVFDEHIEFDESVVSKMIHLRELRDVTVSGDVHYDATSDLAIANLTVEGIMVVPCSITLEDVEVDFSTTSTEVYTFEKNPSNDEFRETKGDIVELYPAIFQLIVMEVPHKVVKEGVEYPKGKGWEVVTEDDFNASKKNAIDPRLAKLKEFKIEE